MKHLKYHSLIYYSVLSFLFVGCTGVKVIQPAPDFYKSSSDRSKTTDEQLSTDIDSQYDFSSAIPDLKMSEIKDYKNSDSDNVFAPESIIESEILPSTKSIRYPDFKVGSKSLRVVLSEKVHKADIYSAGAVSLHSKGKIFTPLRGRIHFQKKSPNLVSIDNGGITKDIFLPCTIVSVSQYNFINYDEKSYRGTFALFNGPGNGLSLINILDVEEYLRGVVPMELGKRGEEDLEALKAQAVAARTYAYKRIGERKSSLFDLYSTVKDQVYGGADVEYREADMAVKMTRDIILTSGDSIVYAYYHSTCGGRTASIEEVWPQKLPKPYLISVPDLDHAGQSYCALSNYFTWREFWSANQLKSILFKNINENCESDQSQINNGEFKLRILDQSRSGRVQTLLVEGYGWKRKIIADKTRYVLRRAGPQFPILRSSFFRIEMCNSKEVIISGNGYGHGVGMCQMGAIGRARVGQKFEEILKAYYTGVSLSICTNSP